jgi:hypothetical protein
MNKYLILTMAFLFLAAIPCIYGEDSEPAEDTSSPESTRKASQEEVEPHSTRSFSDAIASNARNHFGFSLNTQAGYISNLNSVSSANDAMTQSFSLSAFANFGRRKSSLHIGYNIGYNRYSQGDLNDASHKGDVTFTYQVTRNISLRLYDSLSSKINDPFNSFDFKLTPTSGIAPSYINEIASLSQRLTQNRAGGRIEVKLTRDLHFSAFSSYNSYRYGTLEFMANDAVQVGAGLNQRITKWLSFTSTYSTYFNNIDARLSDSQIHSLEIGNFRFKLSRYTAIYASGGVQMAKPQGNYQVRGTFRGGISRSTRGSSLSANYERTMTSANGYSRTLMSDIVSFGFSRRLMYRTNSRLSSSCSRSSDFYNSGHLYGCSAQTQLSYALASNIFAEANYAYQYQKNTNVTLTGIPHYDRHMAFVSLQYTWPSINLRSE